MITFVMEINILDQRESINGLLVKYILAIFAWGKNMEKENGGVIK